MNPILKMKIELYQQNLELRNELKTRKDLLLNMKKNYNQKSRIAKEQMELIQKLNQDINEVSKQLECSNLQNNSNILIFKQNKMVIDSFKSRSEDQTDELAFPEEESIHPTYDKFSCLYDELETWLEEKEFHIETDDNGLSGIRNLIEKNRKKNKKLRKKLENEPDLSKQIEEMQNEIQQKKEKLKNKDEIINKNKQKIEELERIIRAIDLSQREDETQLVLKTTKEVNANTFTKLHINFFNKWEKLRAMKAQLHQHNQEMLMLKQLIPHF